MFFHVRRLPLCFCVAGCGLDIFSLMVFVVASKRSKNLNVCLLTCFVVVGSCCVGTHSGHNTGFQTMFHAGGLVGYQITTPCSDNVAFNTASAKNSRRAAGSFTH